MTKRHDEIKNVAPDTVGTVSGCIRGDVRVRSVLQYAEDREEIRTCGRGTYCRSAGGGMLSYVECTEDGGRVGNELSLQAGSAVLRRSGAVCARMSFVEGETTAFSYGTPYGELRFQVQTRSLRMRATSAGVLVRIVYTVLQAGVPVSDNRLTIAFTAE